ncbi:peptidase M16 [Halomonas sp. ZH2S]|uniref:Protease 3 n=1 Tax=Vreelandella zhuhanensis TaxID=2684210 RepID=A0A7X3KQX7_9GAMM|nr:insulinase family protein [Halomonas zhuhanensis]MWJ27402.1 peptidase M16 [Halomonas zhuhanensis]
MSHLARLSGRPRRHFATLAGTLLTGTLLSGTAWFADSAWALSDEDALADVIKPIVSPYDSRDYRVLALENGLTALLVSDPDADKAAASMNVRVGSAQDPEDLQGLAHFLEHMLFLGTEPYPQADAYQSYISRNAGSHNAFTASQDTNYFFDIEPSALPGALDRFSAFFISPLFNAERLESERNIVHSEYMARIRDEGRRENDVLNQLLNPEHPTTRFAVGSRETLASPPPGEPDLRERVIEFYHNHYGPNVMHLAVVAPQPLDTLESWVVERFADISDRGLEAPVIEEPLATEGTLPSYAEMQSLRDDHEARFSFPIPDPINDYQHKPADLVAHLLGHEGEGSLLDVLREAGLADGLSAGVGRSDGQDALFSVSISLTPEGAEQLDVIQATLFAAIELIRGNGLEAWRYQEQARLAEQAFRFQQRGAPQQEATHLAMNLSRYPLKDVQYAPYRMEGFTPERTKAYADALRPETLIRLYSGPDVEGDSISPWFQAPWDEVESIATREALTGLALPEPNPFIAENLEIIEGQGDKPTALIDTPSFAFWHLQNDSFNTPKVEWRLSLQHPSVSHSAEEAVLARLLAGWLNDSLNERLYPARIAGHSMNAYAHARGMTLAFSGWRDGQAPLMEEVITQLKEGHIDPATFKRVRYRYQQQWQNAPQDALYRQASDTLSEALIRPQWSTEALLEASDVLTLHNLEDFRQRFVDGLYVDAMAVGNLTPEQAQAQAKQLRAMLLPRLTRRDIPSLTPLAVGDDAPLLHPHSERNESLVLRYLQGNERSLQEQAALSVLGQWLDTPFYQRLRTEQQLGYVVNAGYSPLLDAPGIALMVQSSDVDSAGIAEHIDTFLKNTGTRLVALDEADLAPYRQAVHDQLQQRATSLGSLANRYWQATALDEINFERREQHAARALEVSVDTLQTLWPSLLEQSLDIRFDPGVTPSELQEFRESRPPLPSADD